ncbi:hypothetical protein, partial [Pedobacter sp. UBA4863]|uniref:hypothetical protein n=1 Tax=Pedobacter sp. UBA4863 TaxID=1947060 RepID=UPI0025E79A93
MNVTNPYSLFFAPTNHQKLDFSSLQLSEYSEQAVEKTQLLKQPQTKKPTNQPTNHPQPFQSTPYRPSRFWQ